MLKHSFQLFIFSVALALVPMAQAEFAISGTTITQSGTDTDLSGLAAISGVTQIETARMTIYDVGDNSLSITGDLTINADERLEFGDGTPALFLNIQTGGKLMIYGTNDGNTSTENIANAQIINDQQSANHWSPAQGILVNGTLELQGGMIDIGSHVNFEANSVFRTRAGVIKMSDAANGSPNLLRFANAGGGTIDVEDFILYGGSNAFERSDITTTALENYSPRNCKEGIMQQGSTANPSVLNDFNPENCEIDTAYIASGGFYLIYGMADKAPTATVHFDHSNATGGGITEVRKVANFTITDGDSGERVENASIFTTDTVHSTTRDYSDGFYVSLVSGDQILTQHTYSTSTDSSGQASIDKLLAYAGVLPGENVGRGSAAREVLYKSKATDHNYRDDFFIASYNHQLATVSDVDLTGLGEATVNWSLFADSFITESSSAVVAAYTELETPQKLYDYAKLWLVENYAGETETLVSLEGDTIVSDFNLTLDPNAAAVFTFDGSTITAKASTFSGSIKLPSDKAVTLSNNATVSGSVQDANGDSSITVSVPSGFDNQIRVFASQAEAVAQNNALGSGTSFLYQSATYGGQTLWYRLESATGAYIIEAYTLPTETGVYQQNLVATDTEVALSDIQSTTSKLDTTLSDNGGIYQFTAQALENAPISTTSEATSTSSSSAGLTTEQDQTLNDIYALLQTVQGLVLDLFSWGD